MPEVFDTPDAAAYIASQEIDAYIASHSAEELADEFIDGIDKNVGPLTAEEWAAERAFWVPRYAQTKRELASKAGDSSAT